MLAKGVPHLPHLHHDSADHKDYWPTPCHTQYCNYTNPTDTGNHHSHHTSMPHFPKIHFHSPHATHTTKVALAGITGKLGQLIAKHLLSCDNVEVHGIARNPDKLPEHLKSNPRLKLFYSSMKDADSMRDAVKGCSILVSTVLADPATEVAMQKAMIDACIAEHVPRFMPNDFTVDWRSVDLSLLPQKKVNQDIFDYLAKNQTKIKGVHVLIGGFMETLFSYGFFFDPSKSPADGLTTWGTGDEVWELTSYNNAAMWASAVALDKDATGFLRFLGDRLSVKEIAKTLQEVYDLKSPIPFTSKGSIAELEQQVKRGIAEDFDSHDFWKWKGLSYTLSMSNGKGYLEMPLSSGRYVTQLFQETLEQWLQDKKLEDLSKTIQSLR